MLPDRLYWLDLKVILTSRSCLPSGWRLQMGRSNNSEVDTAAHMSWPAEHMPPSVSRGSQDQPKANIKAMQPSAMDALSMIISSMSQEPLPEGSDSPTSHNFPSEATRVLQQTVADLPDIRTPADKQAPECSASLHGGAGHSSKDLDSSFSAGADAPCEAPADRPPTLLHATQPSTAQRATPAADNQADLSGIDAADALLPARWPTPSVQPGAPSVAPATLDQQQQDYRAPGVAPAAKAQELHGLAQLRSDAEGGQRSREDVASAPANTVDPPLNSLTADMAHAHNILQTKGVEAAGYLQLQSQEISNDLADGKTQSWHQPLAMPGPEVSSTSGHHSPRTVTEAALTGSGALRDLALGSITGQTLQEAAPLQEGEALRHLPAENLRALPGKLPGISRRQGEGPRGKEAGQNLSDTDPAGATFGMLQDESFLSESAPDPPLAPPLGRGSIRNNALDALQKQVSRGRAGLTGSKAFRQGLHRLQEDIASAYGTESGGHEHTPPLLGLPGGYGSMRRTSIGEQDPGRMQPAEDLAASIADAIAQALERRQGKASPTASEARSQASDLLPCTAPSADRAAAAHPDSPQSNGHTPADGQPSGTGQSVANANVQATGTLPLFNFDRPDGSAVSAQSLMGIPDAADGQHHEVPHGTPESSTHANLMSDLSAMPQPTHEGLDLSAAQPLPAASRPLPEDAAAAAADVQSTDLRHGGPDSTRHAMPMLNLSALPLPTHLGPTHHSDLGPHFDAAHAVSAAASLASWTHGSTSQGSSSSSSFSLDAAAAVQQGHVPAMTGVASGLPPFSSDLHADMHTAAVPNMLTMNTSAAVSESCSTCSSSHASSLSEMDAPEEPASSITEPLLQHDPPHAMPSASMSSCNSSNTETGLQASTACHGSGGLVSHPAAGPVQASNLRSVHDNGPAYSSSANASQLGTQQHGVSHQEAKESPAELVIQQGNEPQGNESSSSTQFISGSLAFSPDSAPQNELARTMAPDATTMSLLSASLAPLHQDLAAAHESSESVMEPLLPEHRAPSDHPSGEAIGNFRSWWVKAAADSNAVMCRRQARCKMHLLP